MLTTLKSWIAARPVAAYYAMTLAISWGYWMTLLVQGKRVGPGSEVSHFPGLLGPFLAAVILTAYLNGWPGVRELFGRMTRWRTAWPWGLAVAMAPLPLAILVMVALHFSGIPLPSWHDFQVFPGLPAGLPLWAVVLLVFLVNGYGEEVGWRGFVMEKWLTRYGRFGTTVRVAALWIVWHIPLFRLSESMAALVGPMLLGWILALILGAFVLAHLYLFSGRSIFVLALWHASYNMVVAPPGAAGVLAAAISTVVMIWGAALAWSWWNNRHQDFSN